MKPGKRDGLAKGRAHMANRTAMIDVGGGFRAIYGAGVMDRMLEDGIHVDHCYGARRQRQYGFLHFRTARAKPHVLHAVRVP